MLVQQPLGRLEHLTFKGNLKESRYGWLRLTPAYSVHLVSEILRKYPKDKLVVLDPFCGTGTTALVCAEQGIVCDTTDINPFLIWLTKAKTRSYDEKSIASFQQHAKEVSRAITDVRTEPPWLPNLHQIEKWWEPGILESLGRSVSKIKVLAETLSDAVVDLLKIAFCRTLISQANVSFGHQSMSFKRSDGALTFEFMDSPEKVTAESWNRACLTIAEAAAVSVLRKPRAVLCDARKLTEKLGSDSYTCVITSPPYPNRMSYIRELRPYMYWLGYLHDGREAGEFDWKSIGGTWGCATSNLMKWKPAADRSISFKGFHEILKNIERQSLLLSRYVEKYFYDISVHCEELFKAVNRGGNIHYIVGNSKFYDVVLPVESIYASLFRDVGFTKVAIHPIRKRTSKKELFEFLVSAQKPA